MASHTTSPTRHPHRQRGYVSRESSVGSPGPDPVVSPPAPAGAGWVGAKLHPLQLRGRATIVGWGLGGKTLKTCLPTCSARPRGRRTAGGTPGPAGALRDPPSPAGGRPLVQTNKASSRQKFEYNDTGAWTPNSNKSTIGSVAAPLRVLLTKILRGATAAPMADFRTGATGPAGTSAHRDGPIVVRIAVARDCWHILARHGRGLRGANGHAAHITCVTLVVSTGCA